MLRPYPGDPQLPRRAPQTQVGSDSDGGFSPSSLSLKRAGMPKTEPCRSRSRPLGALPAGPAPDAAAGAVETRVPAAVQGGRAAAPSPPGGRGAPPRPPAAQPRRPRTAPRSAGRGRRAGGGRRGGALGKERGGCPHRPLPSPGGDGPPPAVGAAPEPAAPSPGTPRLEHPQGWEALCGIPAPVLVLNLGDFVPIPGIAGPRGWGRPPEGPAEVGGSSQLGIPVPVLGSPTSGGPVPGPSYSLPSPKAVLSPSPASDGGGCSAFSPPGTSHP